MPEKYDISIYLMSISEAARLTEAHCRECFPERWERSLKFRLEDDRLRSLAAGELLYSVLGLREKDILKGQYGKPYCEAAPCFSLSHSGEYAVLAVGEAELGVDIEPDRKESPRVAKRVMQPGELIWMDASPTERFPILWTMKEALSKTVGLGLGLGFEKYSVLPLLEGGMLECAGMRVYGRSIAIPGCRLGLCCAGEIGNVTLEYFTDRCNNTGMFRSLN